MSVIAGIGLSSGINYDDLISKMMQIERQPIDTLNNEKTTYNDKITAYSGLSTKLSTLMSAIDKLRTPSNFYAKSVSVSDPTVLEATTSNTATTGNYSISVTQLAQAHSITHTTGLSDKDSNTVLASGGTFSFTINGETKTVTASSNLTLEQLASEINSQTYTGSVKVEASVVNTGTSSSPSYKLILKSNTTGASNGITIVQDNSVLNLGAATVQLVAAQDARFTADALSVTRGSNTVSDVLNGVTFTLKKASSTTLTVTNDNSTISQNVQSFVTAYNDVVSDVSSNSTYDDKTHTGGPLFTESTPRYITDRLRNIIINTIPGLPTDLQALSQIGISTNRDGTLSIDTGTLNTKLSSNLTDVANLFTDSSNGIGKQIYDYLDSVTKSITGAIAIKVDGLTRTVSNISGKITDLENKLTTTEQDLRSKFASLESLLGSIKTQGQFISQFTSKG